MAESLFLIHRFNCNKLWLAFQTPPSFTQQLFLCIITGNRAHLEWMYGSNGCIPDKPVEGGRDSCGEVYYIGRHSHHGDTIPGKIQASHKCLYISYDGKEISKKEYGVLVEEES